MNNEQISMLDFIIETHIALERQGPGSVEMTMKALSFLDDRNNILRVADLGCGTGGQTMVLAQNLSGTIIGVDLFPNFVNAFNNKAKEFNLDNRVQGIAGSMDNLPFQKEEFDLIWSEGAIDNIGFEKGLVHWKDFIKRGGYVAVTCPSWFTEEHPAEVEQFWNDAGSGLDSIEYNISMMQKAGYAFVAAFALPEECWTKHYFIPRGAMEKVMLEKYPGSKIVEDCIARNQHEADLYARFHQHYGYAFYIGRKM